MGRKYPPQAYFSVSKIIPAAFQVGADLTLKPNDAHTKRRRLVYTIMVIEACILGLVGRTSEDVNNGNQGRHTILSTQTLAF